MIRITTTIGSIPRIEQQAREDFAARRQSPYQPGSVAHRIWVREYERAKLAELGYSKQPSS